jgi:hypothetical protein
VVLDTTRPSAEECAVAGALDIPGHALVLLEARPTSKFPVP